MVALAYVSSCASYVYWDVIQHLRRLVCVKDATIAFENFIIRLKNGVHTSGHSGARHVELSSPETASSGLRRYVEPLQRILDAPDKQ